MLAQTMFLLATITVFAASATFAVASYARARVALAAKALVTPGVAEALAQYETAVSRTIAQQAPPPPSAGVPVGPPGPVPILNGDTSLPGGGDAFPTVTQVIAPETGSPLQLAVTIVPTTQSFPACTPAGANVNAGPDQVLNGQCSPWVQESRLSLAITADAGPPDGAGGVVSLAHNRYTVTLRLFAQPPYVMLAGAKDAADPTDPHEADLAGWSGDLPARLPPAASGDDTTIHVQEACLPATGDCSQSYPRQQDDVQNHAWSNGNGVP